MQFFGTRLSAALGLGLGLAASACGSDSLGTPPPTTNVSEKHFTVRIENIAPFTNRKAGAYTIKSGATEPGPLAPGDAFEVSFTAGRAHRLVFASMFGQSNDWFFAPDPTGIRLYDDMGVPISGDVTSQVYLWDAGTEIDEEPAVGAHTGPKQRMSTDGPGAADPQRMVRRVSEPAVLSSGALFARPSVAAMIKVTLTPSGDRAFTLRIENVADDAMTLMTSEGAKPVRVSPGVWALGTGNAPIFDEGLADRAEGLEDIAESGNVTALLAATEAHSGVATPLSPGVWVRHRGGAPLFTAGQRDRGQGLENIAERGDITVLSAALKVALPSGVVQAGTFAIAEGATEPGPIRAGGAYTFELTAAPGDRLSFVQMYGASNDWFFAPVEAGIPLFAGDAPVRGDVTSDVRIWDAATELSEEPAIGPNIGAPEGLADTLAGVSIVDEATYGTPASEHLRVTITE